MLLGIATNTKPHRLLDTIGIYDHISKLAVFGAFVPSHSFALIMEWLVEHEGGVSELF